MFESYKAHYKNKYPNCQIKSSDNSFDVFTKDGLHLVSLAKNGAGQLVDMSEKNGCEERHDLSPIPKETRVFKLYANGSIGKSEEYEARKKFVDENVKVCPIKGYAKVPSIEEGGIKAEVQQQSEVIAPAKKPRAKKEVAAKKVSKKVSKKK